MMDQFEDQEQKHQVEDTIIPPSHHDSHLLDHHNSPTHPKIPSPVHRPEPHQQLVLWNHNNKPKYKECLKNHAVGIGGHAVDGCGEFMPAGEDGSIDSLKCAACNCHRNFHRKIPTDAPFVYHQYPPYYRALPPPCGYLHHVAPQQRPLALPSTSGGGGYRDDQEDNSGGSKKRFRTKFSQEQKEKMLELADKLGWRIQREDEGLVQQFCNETGVRRQVFKVWMHNNKHTLGKKP